MTSETFTQKEFAIDVTRKSEVENLFEYLQMNTAVQLSFGNVDEEWSKQWVELLGPVPDINQVQRYLECVVNNDDLMMSCKLAKELVIILKRCPTLRWRIECTYGVAIRFNNNEETVELLGTPMCLATGCSALELLDLQYGAPQSLHNLNEQELVNHCGRYGVRREELTTLSKRTLHVLLDWFEGQENLNRLEKSKLADTEPAADQEVAEILDDTLHMTITVSDDEEAAAAAAAAADAAVSASDSSATSLTGLSDVALSCIRDHAKELGYSSEEVDVALQRCAKNGVRPSISSIMQELARCRGMSSSQPPDQGRDTPPRRKSRMAAWFPPQGTGQLSKVLPADANVGVKPKYFSPAQAAPVLSSAQLAPSVPPHMLPPAQLPPAQPLGIHPSNPIVVPDPEPANQHCQGKKRPHSASSIESGRVALPQPQASATDDQLGQQKQRLAKRDKLLEEQKQLLAASQNAPDDNKASANLRAVPFECHDAPPGVDPSTLRFIVIDGSNVACAYGNSSVYDCRGILVAVQYFLDRGHPSDKVVAVVPRFRMGGRNCKIPTRYNQVLMNLEKQGLLAFTPSRVLDGERQVPHDDAFILDVAADNDGVVVSNDQYRNFLEDHSAKCSRYHPFIRERLLSFMIVRGTIYFAADPFGVGGVTLEQLLSAVPLTPSRQMAGFIGRSQPPPGGLLMQDVNRKNGNRCNSVENIELLLFLNSPQGQRKNKRQPQQNHQPQQQQPQQQQQQPQQQKEKQQKAYEQLQLKQQLLSLFPESSVQIDILLRERRDIQDVNTLSNLLMDKIT